ncbi:MAG: hypothetical protein TU35_008800 [Thermoproteus sp. AZ2]|uniref:Uncharacterized protein n=1 Tax=Thermoproteus sp. AZ2 TaxID=1609232 RepID=A0ACC6V2P2_9CREN
MNKLFLAGLALVFIGFAIMAIAPFLYLASSSSAPSNVEVAGAGCIFLFFVPICFGAGAPQLLSIALVITAALLVVAIVLSALFMRRR